MCAKTEKFKEALQVVRLTRGRAVKVSCHNELTPWDRFIPRSDQVTGQLVTLQTEMPLLFISLR